MVVVQVPVRVDERLHQPELAGSGLAVAGWGPGVKSMAEWGSGRAVTGDPSYSRRPASRTSQIRYAGDAMADEVKNGLSRGGSSWDSSPEWAAARERARAEVQAAFAPKEQLCAACGRSEATAARNCPHCGASYVVVQPKLSKRAWLAIAGVVVVVLAAGGVAWLLVSPSINHLKKTAAERDARNFAAFIRSETDRLTIEQRLHRGRGAIASESPAALVSDLSAAINADARARVAAGTLKAPIQHTTCSAVDRGPARTECRAGRLPVHRGHRDDPSRRRRSGASSDIRSGRSSTTGAGRSPGARSTRGAESRRSGRVSRS